MDLERAIEFILDQQAKMAVAQAKAAEAHERFEEQFAKLAEADGRIKSEIEQTNQVLRRAIKLGIQEARAERRRRQKVAEDMAELRASQALTEQALRSFIDSLRRGTNGSSHQ